MDPYPDPRGSETFSDRGLRKNSICILKVLLCILEITEITVFKTMMDIMAITVIKAIVDIRLRGDQSITVLSDNAVIKAILETSRTSKSSRSRRTSQQSSILLSMGIKVAKPSWRSQTSRHHGHQRPIRILQYGYYSHQVHRG